eukprot:1158622-Pelagomonas_calceolata.AAC.2
MPPALLFAQSSFSTIMVTELLAMPLSIDTFQAVRKDASTMRCVLQQLTEGAFVGSTSIVGDTLHISTPPANCRTCHGLVLPGQPEELHTVALDRGLGVRPGSFPPPELNDPREIAAAESETP